MKYVLTLHKNLEEFRDLKGAFIIIKRFIAILLVLVMCLSMSSMVFAAEIQPIITDTAESTIDDDGWTLLDDSITTEGSGIVLSGGVETWNYTGYVQQHVGDFTMYGYNLTPVKTIATSDLNRYLTIYTDFTCNSASILTVQIREYSSGNVLAQSQSSATTSGSVTVQAGSYANPMSGKKVQIYFKVTDAYGNYSGSRQCNISYGYTLRGVG